MKNTSLGFHTFSVTRKLNFDEYISLREDFFDYAKHNADFKIAKLEIDNEITWEFSHTENKGIKWRLSVGNKDNGYILRKVEAIINPRLLIDNSYIQISTEADMDFVKKAFNEQASDISPDLLKFKNYSLNRADYCLNIDTEELGYTCSAKDFIKLIQKGDIPDHFEEYTEYSKIAHRRVTMKHSFYLVNSSVNINFYWKYPQQTEDHPNYENREESRNIIRLEVQCKYKKLYEMLKPYYTISDDFDEDEPRISPKKLLTDKISKETVRSYLERIIRKGHYYTLDIARNLICSKHFKPKKEARLLNALELVNNHGGIAAAKKFIPESSDMSLRKFDKALRELDELMINPVTIPRRWSVKMIENPMCKCSEYLLDSYYFNP